MKCPLPWQPLLVSLPEPQEANAFVYMFDHGGLWLLIDQGFLRDSGTRGNLGNETCCLQLSSFLVLPAWPLALVYLKRNPSCICHGVKFHPRLHSRPCLSLWKPGRLSESTQANGRWNSRSLDTALVRASSCQSLVCS